MPEIQSSYPLIHGFACKHWLSLSLSLAYSLSQHNKIQSHKQIDRQTHPSPLPCGRLLPFWISWTGRDPTHARSTCTSHICRAVVAYRKKQRCATVVGSLPVQLILNGSKRPHGRGLGWVCLSICLWDWIFLSWLREWAIERERESMLACETMDSRVCALYFKHF